MATLATKLVAFYESMMDRVGPADAQVLNQVLQDLRAAGIETRAARTGEMAPDFTLPDQHGRTQRLAHSLAAGPAVLVFYRGGWSPLCELTLRAWQDAEPQLRAAGASVLAISPDDCKAGLETAAGNWIGFPLLADTSNAVAAAYGLDFEMPREAVRLYTRCNARVGKRCSAWRIPITATYVISPEGIIRAAHVDVCPFVRMEPRDALAAIKTLPHMQPA